MNSLFPNAPQRIIAHMEAEKEISLNGEYLACQNSSLISNGCFFTRENHSTIINTVRMAKKSIGKTVGIENNVSENIIER